MGFKCGIVGLPNVGKSTLFNALTQTAAAQAANYPFCTIEPNVGDVAVPDTRLDKLAQTAKSAQIIPTRITFVDIAGLVRGASKGEGLGNQFLANIREVDAVVHVLRCFEDDDITHVEGRIDPVGDADTVETELMLADLDSLERRIGAIEKKAKAGEKEAKEQFALMTKALTLLREGKPARCADLAPEEREPYRQLGLMTQKPVLYVANVEEGVGRYGQRLFQARRGKGQTRRRGLRRHLGAHRGRTRATPRRKNARTSSTVSASKNPDLNRLIRAGYALLGLITYFTVGPKETRAWTVTKGSRAPQAAGVIHTDFEKGFIRAETIAYDDYVSLGGEAGARDAGKLRLEGKDYVVADGDVMHFRFNN